MIRAQLRARAAKSGSYGHPHAGLYGNAAPASVQTFTGLCEGTLTGLPGVTYRGSVASRVEQGKRIVLGRLASGAAQDIERSIDSTGYVRSTLVSRADAFANTDNNGLSHDRPGRVSMRRGGGNFEFVIAPAANPSLDADYVVIGQVLTEEEESADLLRAINTVPVRRPKAETAIYLAVAKAGGDPRTRVETVYRPLVKVSIVDCSVKSAAASPI